METITLGRTGIVTNKNGFGALPIQRISDQEAVYLLKKAYDSGITFFDTARFYTVQLHFLLDTKLLAGWYSAVRSQTLQIGSSF